MILTAKSACAGSNSTVSDDEIAWLAKQVDITCNQKKPDTERDLSGPNPLREKMANSIAKKIEIKLAGLTKKAITVLGSQQRSPAQSGDARLNQLKDYVSKGDRLQTLHQAATSCAFFAGGQKGMLSDNPNARIYEDDKFKMNLNEIHQEADQAKELGSSTSNKSNGNAGSAK